MFQHRLFAVVHGLVDCSLGAWVVVLLGWRGDVRLVFVSGLVILVECRGRLVPVLVVPVLFVGWGELWMGLLGKQTLVLGRFCWHSEERHLAIEAGSEAKSEA